MGSNEDNSYSGDIRRRLEEEHIEELQDEMAIVDQIEEDYERRVSRRRKRIIITVVLIFVLVAAVLAVLILQTYDSVQVLENHQLSDAGNNGYESFAGNILKYNRDGVSLMNANGEDKWNQAVQIQQPTAAVTGDHAVVADVAGTAIYIFNDKGMSGHATCAKPIEKVSVSAGGTVAVIQENGATPVVSCFGPQGDLILEHQAALSESGYPIATAVSDDGEVLAVSYLQVSENGVSGQVIYYDIKTKDKDKKLLARQFDGEVAGEIFFMGDTSVVVAERSCILYEGVKEPKEKQTIRFEGDIEKVFRDKNYFGFITRAASGERMLQVYARGGSKKLEKVIQGSYEQVSFSDKQIMLYSGQECSIYTMRGIHRFNGQLQDNTLYITPLAGINRYAVVTNDGIATVYLTR